VPQSIYSFWYPGDKWGLNCYEPPESWRVLPESPIPDPPYPGFWYQGQPSAPGPWVSKAFGSFPPGKVHMAEDLQSTPKFGFWKINPAAPFDYGFGRASKYWLKLRMFGQPTHFYMHITTINDDGTETRQTVKVKPKKSMQQWNQHMNDERAKKYQTKRDLFS
jgi:hypothetical protein